MKLYPVSRLLVSQRSCVIYLKNYPRLAAHLTILTRPLEMQLAAPARCMCGMSGAYCLTGWGCQGRHRELVIEARKGNEMIDYVIRFENGMVMVFNERGEQMPEYQGRYEEVKDKILADAPESAKLSHGVWRVSEEPVPRKEW